MKGFTKIVELTPAFDKRDKNPAKNYGIHNVELRMILRGPLGATQFVLYTNWQLPHVTQEMIDDNYGHDSTKIKVCFLPLPADLGYHWNTRRYDTQHSQPCKYTKSGKCYYDGSGLNAYRIYEVLIREGSDGVWRELKEYYDRVASDAS